jgi:hypothetical protein
VLGKFQESTVSLRFRGLQQAESRLLWLERILQSKNPKVFQLLIPFVGEWKNLIPEKFFLKRPSSFLDDQKNAVGINERKAK